MRNSSYYSNSRVKVCQCQRKFHWNSQDSMLSQKNRKKITNQKVSSKNKKNHPKIVWKPPTPTQTLKLFSSKRTFSQLTLYPLAAHTKLSAASRFGFAHAFRMRAWKKDKKKSSPKKTTLCSHQVERFGMFFCFSQNSDKQIETLFCSWDLFLTFWNAKNQAFSRSIRKHTSQQFPIPTPPQKKKDKKTSGKKSN